MDRRVRKNNHAKRLWLELKFIGESDAKKNGFSLGEDIFVEAVLNQTYPAGHGRDPGTAGRSSVSRRPRRMAGAFSGATMAVIVGYILQVTGGNYRIPFFMAGGAYLLALLIIQLLVPKVMPLGDVDDLPPRVFSIGSFVGFGFMGSIFGAFGGWCTGLISRTSGSGLLKYMALGAAIGVVTGIISGIVITNAGLKTKPEVRAG